MTVTFSELWPVIPHSIGDFSTRTVKHANQDKPSLVALHSGNTLIVPCFYGGPNLAAVVLFTIENEKKKIFKFRLVIYGSSRKRLTLEFFSMNACQESTFCHAYIVGIVPCISITFLVSTHPVAPAVGRGLKTIT